MKKARMIDKINGLTAFQTPSVVKRKILEEIYFSLPSDPIIVEIGTQRHGARTSEDGQSTRTLGRLVEKHGGAFWSVDNDEGAIRAARADCEGAFFKCERGRDFLLSFPHPIDFLYLDGGDDPEENLIEYEIALKTLAPGSVVLVDDCMTYGGRDYGKGDSIKRKYGLEISFHFGRYRVGLKRN